jgi:hypothetical protein
LIAVGLATTMTPADSAAQLPFEVTQHELGAVDTLAMQWQKLSSSIGSVEGELHYLVEKSSEGACRAVGVLGMLRLRNYYISRQEERPISLRMRLLCGQTIRGSLEYDGLNTTFELRDRATGELLYHERIRGLP